MSEPEIIMSPLCREICEDGNRIQVDIYRGEDKSGWILEVIDEENASTVWDEPFDTDREALEAKLEVIEKDCCCICMGCYSTRSQFPSVHLTTIVASSLHITV